MSASPVLIACGLKQEARWLRRQGVMVVVGGLDPVGFEAALERAAAGARGVLSMGLAGGLAPGLRAGDWIVGTLAGGDDRWAGWLAALLPGATRGGIHADGTMVAAAAAKRALHVRTGAIACDMESHVAARVAARHGLPFAVARVVSDPADRTLPPAARVGMTSDGGVAVGAVLRELARRPGQLPALLALARDAARAGRAFRAGYDMLAASGFAPTG